MPTITGTAGPDSLSGTTGDDVISALGGNDLIDASQGNDTVDGGPGTDRLIVDLADPLLFAPIAGPIAYTISGSLITGAGGALHTQLTSVERIEITDLRADGITVNATGATPRVDVTAGSGNDVITLTGAGVVRAGLGANTVNIDGGSYNSVFFGVDTSQAMASVTTAPNGDTTVSYTIGGTAVISTLHAVNTAAASAPWATIESGVAGQGLRVDASAWTSAIPGIRIGLADSDYDDVLIGSSGADVIISWYVNNVGAISDGNDTKLGGGGADNFDYAVAAPTDFGDHIVDIDADDLMDFSYYNNGLDGGDLIFLGHGAFTGVARQMRYEAHDGKTFITIDRDGDGQADSGVTIDNGEFELQDILTPGAPNQLRIVATQNMIAGTNAAGTSNGGAGADVIRGYDGNDILNGNGGNDQLDGGHGADQMNGGGSDDVYIVDDAGDVTVEAAAGGLDSVISFVSHTLGAEVERLTLTGLAAIDGTGNASVNAIFGNSAANQLFGQGGNDLLWGYAGDDTLDGGTGIDTLRGGTGNDAYHVDSKNDVVVEAIGEGTDTVFAAADYTLGDFVENLSLLGAAIKGIGNGLDNIVTGNANANALYGGAGADTLVGGFGDDTYYVENVGDVVTEAAAAGTDTVSSTVSFTLGANIERLVLTGAAAINGTGNGLANTLTGNGAANVLNGGAGVDVMKGAGGNDTFYVDHKDDITEEAGGGGTDTVHASVDYSVATQNIENLFLTGAAVKATGNSLANTITGNANANVIYGGGGTDTLVGGLGNDTYYVDSLDDVVTEAAGEGSDTVNSASSHVLGANLEVLRLTGTGATNGTGNALNNTILGNAGNNVIDGGTGADTMKGGAGNDSYVVDAAGDAITELAGEGTDGVSASISHTLAANVENLTLSGASAINGAGNTLANMLTGNGAVNILNGGGGDDALHGGLGNDTLVGGTGLDSFWFETALGATNIDNITDFAAVDDTLYLDRTIFTGIAANGALATGAFRLGGAAADADDRILYDQATGNLWYDADGTGGIAAVQFAHVTAGTAMTAADFFAVA